MQKSDRSTSASFQPLAVVPSGSRKTALKRSRSSPAAQPLGSLGGTASRSRPYFTPSERGHEYSLAYASSFMSRSVPPMRVSRGRPNVGEMPRPVPLISDARNASLPVSIMVPNRQPDCRPVDIGEGWLGLALGNTSSHDWQTLQISNLVINGRDALCASGFRRMSPDGNVCQPPERRGDAVSHAADFGRAQRVPTGADHGAASTTRLSARGLW